MWWAVKLFVVRYYLGNPSKKLKIVGVTGTNGKTTTATLLYKITRELGYKAGLIGTVEILSNGEKLTFNGKMPSTTPDSVSLTKIFAIMVEARCEYVFMEVSSHAMDQNRVAGVEFVGGVFTNLTQDHLDYHKSMENYFIAKKKFFTMLPKSAFALANVDNEYGLDMLDGIKARAFSYGFMGHEDFHGEIKKLDFQGLEVDITLKKQYSQIVKSKLLGRFNAYNLLAVWSACTLLEFDMPEAHKIMETIEPPVGRFEHFMSRAGVVTIIDYAHTPDALENVLHTIQEIKPKDGKIISVFGCGGDRDPLKRRIMGKLGVNLSDIAILTSDNPRSEDPEKILAEMKTDFSINDLKKVRTIANRREAILEAVKIAKKGDIILCAGKGHETYQEIKGVKHHFSDMEEFKKAFK